MLRSRPNGTHPDFSPLLPSEVARAQTGIQIYRSRQSRGDYLCHWEDLFIHVGDEPRHDPETGKTRWLTWSGVSNSLPTLRRSSGLYISALQGRHVTIAELFACMGFPSFHVFAQSARVPLYSLSRNCFTYWDFRHALGNSQHCANVGTVMAAALACCSLR